LPDEGFAAIERSEQLVANVNRWIAERPKIIDAEMASAAQLQTDQLQACKADLEKAQKAELFPIGILEDAVRIKYRVPLKAVLLSLDEMEQRNRAWLISENLRLQNEKRQQHLEANRATVEAAELAVIASKPGATIEQRIAADEAEKRADQFAHAADRPIANGQTKGDYARTAMSLHSNWQARITDPDKAIAYFENDPEMRIAKLDTARRLGTKLAKLHKNAAQAPPGFEFYNDARAR